MSFFVIILNIDKINTMKAKTNVIQLLTDLKEDLKGLGQQFDNFNQRLLNIATDYADELQEQEEQQKPQEFKSYEKKPFNKWKEEKKNPMEKPVTSSLPIVNVDEFKKWENEQRGQASADLFSSETDTSSTPEIPKRNAFRGEVPQAKNMKEVLQKCEFYDLPQSGYWCDQWRGCNYRTPVIQMPLIFTEIKEMKEGQNFATVVAKGISPYFGDQLYFLKASTADVHAISEMIRSNTAAACAIGTICSKNKNGQWSTEWLLCELLS